MAVPAVAISCVLYCRVKPAIFDLLLAVCIAAYLGVAYVAVQVREEKQEADVLFSSEITLATVAGSHTAPATKLEL